MRITESQLRKIIREVAEELLREYTPRSKFSRSGYGRRYGGGYMSGEGGKYRAPSPATGEPARRPTYHGDEGYGEPEAQDWDWCPDCEGQGQTVGGQKCAGCRGTGKMHFSRGVTGPENER